MGDLGQWEDPPLEGQSLKLVPLSDFKAMQEKWEAAEARAQQAEMLVADYEVSMAYEGMQKRNAEIARQRAVIEGLRGALEKIDALGWLRCEVTGNPCGTDTWTVGRSCPCQACQTWLVAHGALAAPEGR